MLDNKLASHPLSYQLNHYLILELIQEETLSLIKLIFQEMPEHLSLKLHELLKSLAIKSIGLLLLKAQISTATIFLESPLNHQEM